jgi:amino acid transporter
MAAAMFPEGFRSAGKHVLISVAVLGVTGLNFLNVETIGRAETWIVAAKIGILLFFTGVGSLDRSMSRGLR